MATAVATRMPAREKQDVVEMWIQKQRAKRHRGKQRGAKPLPVNEDTRFHPSRGLAMASKRGTVTKEDFRRIAKTVVPFGIHEEIAYALELNHQHKGAICELLEGQRPITKMHVYSIVVSYLRHEHTSYNHQTVKGGLVRKQFNDHETAKSIMGERSKW